MHTSKKIKTRYKYKVQYTSIKQNKCVPKKLEVQTSMELYKKIENTKKKSDQAKIPSCSESPHLLA